jgi:hypothetical protein
VGAHGVLALARPLARPLSRRGRDVRIVPVLGDPELEEVDELGSKVSLLEPFGAFC